jgi:hypothetical protein
VSEKESNKRKKKREKKERKKKKEKSKKPSSEGEINASKLLSQAHHMSSYPFH